MDLNYFATFLIVIGLSSVQAIEYGHVVPKIHDIAFMVHLSITTQNVNTKVLNRTACGGIIYTERIVLTAANCLYYENDIVTKVEFVAGSVDRLDKRSFVQRRQAKGFRIQEDYVIQKRMLLGKIKNYPYNIAMLYTDKPFVQDKYVVKTVKLHHTNIKSELSGEFFGWGGYANRKISQVLQGITLMKISHETCKRRYNHEAGAKTFCAISPYGKAVVTYGDFGGPFIYDGKVIGLHSYGSGENGPIIFTNILKYTTWVKSNLEPPSHKCIKPGKKYCAL